MEAISLSQTVEQIRTLYCSIIKSLIKGKDFQGTWGILHRNHSDNPPGFQIITAFSPQEFAEQCACEDPDFSVFADQFRAAARLLTEYDHILTLEEKIQRTYPCFKSRIIVTTTGISERTPATARMRVEPRKPPTQSWVLTTLDRLFLRRLRIDPGEETVCSEPSVPWNLSPADKRFLKELDQR